MNKKLKSILLIDDNDDDNFLHRIVIEDAEVTDNVVSFEMANKALTYLETKIDGEYPQPDLIFLDINMPLMSGWDFLDEYDQLRLMQKAKVVVVMLTTSQNPDDKMRAKDLGLVTNFHFKPLTTDILMEIMVENFNWKL